MDITYAQVTAIASPQCSSVNAPNPTNAYGLRTVSTLGPYDVANSFDSSSRYEKASFRGYDLSAIVR